MRREVQMKDKKRKKRNIRWTLVLYDLLVFALAAVLLLGLYGGNDKLTYNGMVQQAALAETIGTAIQIIYCISKKQLNAKQIFVPCWKYFLSGSIMLLFVEALKMKFSGGIVSLCVLICTGGLSYVGVLLILRDRFFIDNINKILKRK